MNTIDATYSTWLAQQSHLPFKAYGMDFSKYKCKVRNQGFPKQQGRENVRRAEVPGLSGRLISLDDLCMSPLALEPPRGRELSLGEHKFRSLSGMKSVWRDSTVPAPIFPPGLSCLPKACLSQPMLCFPIKGPIISGSQLPLPNSWLLVEARIANRNVNRRRRASCPMYHDSFGELVNGRSLIPRSASPDDDFEDLTLVSFSPQERYKCYDHCRKTFSESLKDRDPSNTIFTWRSLCEDSYRTSSLTPTAQESRSRNSMPYHRLIKDIDFQDEIFIPNFVDEDPRLDGNGSPLMAGIQYENPHVQNNSSHRRSATADSGVSFYSPLNDFPVERWRRKTMRVSRSCNRNKENNINDGNAKYKSADTVVANDHENRKDEILKLPRWRPITSTPSISSQESTLTVSSLNSPTPQSRELPQESRSAAATASEIHAKQLELIAKHGPGIFQPFIPSRVILEEAGAEGVAEIGANALAPRHYYPGGNTLYHLPPSLLHHHSYLTPLIPPSQNTALWLTGIPSTATYSDILSTIRGGRVYICALNPPIAGAHRTSACKLVFFTRAAAEVFFSRANDAAAPGICIAGTRIRCIWNRILYPEYRYERQSRVLVIRGEPRLMSLAFFDEFFRARFKGDVEARFEIEDSDVASASIGSDPGAAGCEGNDRVKKGWKTYVWRFASLRAQAELAKVALEREMGGIFQVEYGADPCERPW